MIEIQVKSELVQRKLNRLIAQIKDRRAVNKAVAAKLTAMVFRNFESESHDGVPWAPLAPATVEAKAKAGKEKILVWTSHMRQSFLPFSDNDQAGVGALSTKDHADLAKIHEEGIGLPARPMLPTREHAIKEAIVIYGFFIDRLVKS